MTSEAVSSDADSSDAVSSGAASSNAANSNAASSDAPDSIAASIESASGSLDADSAAWFSAYCSGQAKSAEVNPKLIAATSGSGSDAAKAKAASPLLTEEGRSFLNTATALSALPEPAFAGGADYARKTIGALKERSEIFLAAGQSASSGETSKLVSLGADQKAAPGITALEAVVLAPDVVAAARELPACASILG